MTTTPRFPSLISAEDVILLLLVHPLHLAQVAVQVFAPRHLSRKLVSCEFCLRWKLMDFSQVKSQVAVQVLALRHLSRKLVSCGFCLKLKLINSRQVNS